MINTITITGIDDNVEPENLIGLQRIFPYVEWGILYSTKRAGEDRYPSLRYIKRLCQTSYEFGLRLSLHLCGQSARDFMQGEMTWKTQMDYPDAFSRVQVNYKGEVPKEGVNLSKVVGKTLILPYTPPNYELAKSARRFGIDAQILFDESGGKGISPKDGKWPQMLDVPCGYAGGIEVHNILETLGSIVKISLNKETWIDMETGVRDDKNKLDLQKVVTILNTSYGLRDVIPFNLEKI